ncbi:hypothetical protein J2847_006469 [Azospirillum agricola]|uniref:hypothetical protein n=1 Tax=Azospirillum agricola TaxID=1720247 RepID=UPI001AE55EAF|nr:hypothetical protein [Azospirillum agricola]MBP2233134.1 hypothetical protein [Azospirillum agricola]
MAEGRYRSRAELYGNHGGGPDFWGVRGYPTPEDEFPTRVYRVWAYGPEQAHQVIQASGQADGVHLGEPHCLSQGGGSTNKVPHLDYAGPWPWPGKKT